MEKPKPEKKQWKKQKPKAKKTVYKSSWKAPEVKPGSYRTGLFVKNSLTLDGKLVRDFSWVYVIG